MIIAHEYQTLQSWHDLHGPLVQLLLLLLCSIILLLSSFCNLFWFFCSQILLHTWTDWWLVLSNAFLTPVSFYCFLDWRLVLNIAFLTPVSFYCFLDWRLGLNFEHRLSYTSFFLLLSGLKISLEHRLLYTSFLLLLSWTASKRKSVKFASSLIAYNLRFFILSTTLSTTLHKRTHGINQHTKPIIEFSEIPKEARCSQWGPMDIQVFMNFFIIDQPQVRGDGGSNECVSFRHNDPHLALEHFRLGAAHFGTSFLSSRGCRIGLRETVNGLEWTSSDRHTDRQVN
jgi:hypothetical protein